MTERPNRQAWLVGIAEAVAAVADCSRRHVGAVIYDPQTFHVLSTGYNGRAADLPGCATMNACPRGQSDVAPRSSYLPGGPGACDAIHAEDNALRQARDRGIDVRGMNIAVTVEPCEPCYVLLEHYGIAVVVWGDGLRGLSAARAMNWA